MVKKGEAKSSGGDTDMRYKLVLTGGDTLIISEDQKKMLSPYWGKDTDHRVSVGRSEIKTKSIKAILEINEENTAAIDKKATVDNTEWLMLCVKMAAATVEEKVERELFKRILPGFKLAKAKCSKELFKELTDVITEFFYRYPHYPRCPFWVYKGYIEDHILDSRKMVSSWWVYVQRNDDAIEQWVKHTPQFEIAR